MAQSLDVKGSTAVRIVGIFTIFNASIVFIVALMASEDLTFGSALLLALSGLAVMVGVGLVNLNYHAWLIAMMLAVLNLFSGIRQMVLAYSRGQIVEITNIVTILMWPTILFCMLLVAYRACRSCKEHQKGAFKRQSPLIGAAIITLTTIILLKASGNTGFLLLGFPFIIFEYGILYAIGLGVQKRLENKSAK